MPAAIEVTPITAADYEELQPLIAAYQRYYRAERIDAERNRAFFRRFIAPSEDGMLLGARESGGPLLGYACLYWYFSSIEPGEVVRLADLYVDEDVRGRGIGRALIDAAAAVGRERGAVHLNWETEPDNHTAQRLYDSTGAARSEWVEYELPL